MPFSRNPPPPPSPQPPLPKIPKELPSRKIPILHPDSGQELVECRDIIFQTQRDHPHSVQSIIASGLKIGKPKYKYDQVMNVTIGRRADSRDDECVLLTNTKGPEGSFDLKTREDVQAFVLNKIAKRKEELSSLYFFVTRRGKGCDVYTLNLKQVFQFPIKLCIRPGAKHPYLTRLCWLSDHFQAVAERRLEEYFSLTTRHGPRTSLATEEEEELDIQNAVNPHDYISQDTMLALERFLALRLFMLDYWSDYVASNEMPLPPTEEEMAQNGGDGPETGSATLAKRFLSIFGLGWVLS